jgi:hypothetical protein
MPVFTSGRAHRAADFEGRSSLEAAMTQLSQTHEDDPGLKQEREGLGSKIKAVLDKRERERHARDPSPGEECLPPLLGGRVGPH